METNQKIKLLGVLTRSEAKFKEKDQPLSGLVELIVEMEKEMEKKEMEKKEAIEIENLDR